MGLPQPIHPLSGHCSVIHNDTLYVYSPAGFQSLELVEGAKWQELPMDVSLTGAQCVKAVPGGDPNAALLYVVGGSVNETASSWDYPGLMHYSFNQEKWDWVRPETWVTQNRQNHAAVYLNASQSILVYSGSQTTGDNGPSSSTFVISTTPPFNVRSGVAAGNPAAVKPMLMPWDESHAVMFGGGAQNEEVFLYSIEAGWQNLGTTLTEPITNMDAVQCTVVSGDDGSKVLERYDMSVTPNKVTRFALLNQGGTVAAPGTIVGEKAKRITINDWPAYNGTLAPTATRAGYSIAQDLNGVAVITGGSEEDPLCIFDQKANAWVNATELFNGQEVVISSTPSSTSSSTTLPTSTTPSATESSTAAAAAPATTPVNNKSRMLTVLGATLGAIFGIAAILILLLFCMKYKREKRKKAQQSGYIEKDRLSFADRGAEFMSEAGGSVGHNYSASMNASQSSLAIISGRGGMNHKRGLGPLGSDASTAGLVTKKSPLGYSEPVEMSKFDMKPAPIVTEKSVEKNIMPQPASRATANIGRSRSSGWSRYFANNEATNLAHMPSGRSTYASERTSTGSQSLYTDSRMYSQPSQTVPPLELNFTKFDGQRLSRVATGSPTLGNSQENLPSQPMQAEIARANSNGSSRSGVSHDDHYARVPVESWTPMGNANYDNRPASSNYTNSVVDQNRDGASSYYHDGTSSFYPKSNYSSFYPGQPRLGEPEDRDSTVTVFPRGVPDNSGPPRPKDAKQDMSWLNLGAGAH
ncbi:uncharacterized protein BDR25DRAFT_17330 [Lindgomyces ingoldianus]|uniref:Uncharacterized protein n=1 Tax=Lindgomyces ingoldianus TaxID=673940 RepID=A0ACB6QZP7_9PLEO|nr:uncharacterized protein BDR25DRAFT_17330 [Lindgomyces ingoldianus]KAF2472015.1 hypothetical protein BDR25DRAFT_17330 [Lindgomyces ingoldianus]